MSPDAGLFLSTAIRVWARNIVAYTAITALAFAPLLLWGLSVTGGGMSSHAFTRYVSLLTPMSLVLSFVASTGIARSVIGQLDRRPVSFGACVATTVARAPAALAVALVIVLVTVAILVALGLLEAAGAFGARGLTVTASAAMCAIHATFYVAGPVVAIERRGVIGALRRTLALTRGRRFALAGIVATVFVLEWAAPRLFGAIALPHEDNLTHALLWQLGFLAAGSALTSTATAVAYYYLRGDRDGDRASALAEVFE